MEMKTKRERRVDLESTIPDNTAKIDDSGHGFCTEYLPVNPIALVKYAKQAAEVLSRYEFDTIAFRGMSGALIVPMISVMVGKPFTMIRKEGSHSSFRIEGCTNFQKYVIVDDFMATGKTAQIIAQEISERCNPVACCVGVLQYMRMGEYSTSLQRIPEPGEYPD
jgi:adenine/guanine phosphoribosyltransferase-like PRPP-binding protein